MHVKIALDFVHILTTNINSWYSIIHHLYHSSNILQLSTCRPPSCSASSRWSCVDRGRVAGKGIRDRGHGDHTIVPRYRLGWPAQGLRHGHGVGTLEGTVQGHQDHSRVRGRALAGSTTWFRRTEEDKRWELFVQAKLFHLDSAPILLKFGNMSMFYPFRTSQDYSRGDKGAQDPPTGPDLLHWWTGRLCQVLSQELSISIVSLFAPEAPLHRMRLSEVRSYVHTLRIPHHHDIDSLF